MFSITVMNKIRRLRYFNAIQGCMKLVLAGMSMSGDNQNDSGTPFPLMLDLIYFGISKIYITEHLVLLSS